MPTASTNNPTSTNRPTRNSVQVSCFRCAMNGFPPPYQLRTYRPENNVARTSQQTTAISHQEASQIRVLGRRQFFRRALEIDAPIAISDKPRGGLVSWSPCDGSLADYVPGLRVEAEIRQREAIL